MGHIAFMTFCSFLSRKDAAAKDLAGPKYLEEQVGAGFFYVQTLLARRRDEFNMTFTPVEKN